MEKIAHRTGLEPTPLAFRVRVLTSIPPMFPHVITLSMPTCLLCDSLSEKSVHHPSEIVYILLMVPIYELF